MDALGPPEGAAHWPFRTRQATARSMLDGVVLWARKILRPAGERLPGIVEHDRRRVARSAA